LVVLLPSSREMKCRKGWIPISMGMTEEGAGMTKREGYTVS